MEQTCKKEDKTRTKLSNRHKEQGKIYNNKTNIKVRRDEMGECKAKGTKREEKYYTKSEYTSNINTYISTIQINYVTLPISISSKD